MPPVPLHHWSCPPGVTLQGILGNVWESVVVTTGGAFGIRWMPPGVPFNTPQCPGQAPTESDPDLMSAVLRGRGLL